MKTLAERVTSLEEREEKRGDRRRRWLALIKRALMMLVSGIEKGEG